MSEFYSSLKESFSNPHFQWAVKILGGLFLLSLLVGMYSGIQFFVGLSTNLVTALLLVVIIDQLIKIYGHSQKLSFRRYELLSELSWNLCSILKKPSAKGDPVYPVGLQSNTRDKFKEVLGSDPVTSFDIPIDPGEKRELASFYIKINGLSVKSEFLKKWYVNPVENDDPRIVKLINLAYEKVQSIQGSCEMKMFSTDQAIEILDDLRMRGTMSSLVAYALLIVDSKLDNLVKIHEAGIRWIEKMDTVPLIPSLIEEIVSEEEKRRFSGENISQNEALDFVRDEEIVTA